MNLKMDSDRAKLFVGGISRDTNEDILKHHFAKYGTVSGSTISIDRSTRSPRGFGFVTFSDLSAADKALQDSHVILGRTDSVTHRPRGFGFITFDSEESVQSVMVKSFHDLNGRQVEVKRAVPKDGNHVYEGFNKLRYKSERGVSKSFPHYSPRNMLPGFAPMPWYGSDGVYAYGTNTYGCWYPMGGYGGNGYAVPSDASRNFWYGPMITGPQTCQVPYANASPSFGYVGGRVGMVGNGAGTWGYNGILGSATNLKFDQPFNANGFVPGNVRSPQGVKQDVDSSSFKGSNGEISS
ncbi:RNA-binding protein 1-like isoform X3 [Gastrolobium bilobum]|uniref:RNA-binding protein 1-like isoform X3 n=1 Tax=Gastrolobium bilobum TaxID=150636 RepID=UPI002AAF63B1|nr:RNA-binding protein 1-like isoform X3 [Gastrolobium bilobum]